MIRFPWQRSFPHAGSPKAGADGPSGEVQPSNSREESSLEPGAPWAGGVRGERPESIVSGARSLQSRISSLLAAALMAAVGAGMLAWYYAEALSRPASERIPARLALPEPAGAGITLPPFGSVASPRESPSVGRWMRCRPWSHLS